MKERPILFSGEMTRAILDGRKTQTRRIIKPQPPEDLKWMGWVIGVGSNSDKSLGCAHWVDQYPLSTKTHTVRCPYGQPGDRLWVRETWKLSSYMEGEPLEYQFKADGATFEEDTNLSEEYPSYDDWWERICSDADKYLKKINHPTEEDGNYHWHQGQSPLPWKPSIFMPRWASRITLEVVNVRVERLQDISESDATAEGSNPILVPPDGGGAPFTEGFIDLWDSINFKRGYPWQSNPWVWVIDFKRIK